MADVMLGQEKMESVLQGLKEGHSPRCAVTGNRPF